MSAVLSFAMIAPGDSDGQAWALLASGPATALYGAVIFSSRGGGLRTTLGTIAIALVGISHAPWLLVLMALISPVASNLGFGGPSEWGMLFFLTGMGYAIVATLCTRSALSCAIILPAALIAGACVSVPSSGVPPYGTAVACALLHASIASSLLVPTLREIDRRWRPGLCRSCGYDLAGISASRCPECGNPLVASAGSCEGESS